MSLGRLISWVLFFGLRPRWFVFGLVFGLFSAFSDETQVWLGDLRVVVCWWFCDCCRCGLICLLIWTNCVLCTNSFHCLCSCKDRASGRHRPNSRKKKLKFRPSGSLTLTMQRGNCINLVAFWMAARSQRAMKSVKHRKLSCYCPVPKKDLARLLKNIMPICRNSLTKMSCKSTRTHSSLMTDKVHVRGL